MKQEMTELVAEVLIETYWNVKSFAVQDHLAGLCINRNILECKVNFPDKRTFVACCINRNILECKV